MYTELCIAVDLKSDTPIEVIDVLRYMCEGGENAPALPNHDFFMCDRWRWVFTCDSYYFRGNSHRDLQYDDILLAYQLTSRANLKNYSYEIEKFIDWLTPYIDAEDGDFLGHKRYEEDALPTLLIHPNQWKQVTI